MQAVRTIPDRARRPQWAELKPEISALVKRPTVATNIVLRAFGIEAPPVPIEDIARGLGVVVHPVRDPGWSGALTWKGDIPHVFLRDEDAPPRKRFTLAHELGHLLLHPTGTMFRDNARFSGDGREAEANRFAAALLMPMWMLEPLVTRSARTLDELADLFDVSSEAMTYQLDNLR